MSPKPLAALLAGLSVLPAQAQTTPMLDAIVVTATRMPQPARHVVGDVSVLARADIERAGQRTLVELLSTLPGVEINQIGGAGATSTLFLRGANSQHTLILVDGVRMNSATLGIARLEHLPLELVERIEVVRGPMSPLYGSDAIGGVIQIFTRRGGGAPRLSGAVGMGGYGRRSVDVSLTGGADTVRYALAAGHGEQDGFSARQPPNYPDRDGYRNDRMSLNLELDIGPLHTVALHGMASDGRAQFDDGRTAYDSRSKVRLGNVGLSLTSRLGTHWTSRLNVGFAHEKAVTRGYSDPPLGGAGAPYGSEVGMDQWQYGWQLDGRTALGAPQLLIERLEWEVGGDVGYTVRRRHRDALMLGWRHESGAHAWQASLRRDDDSQFGMYDTGAARYAYALTPAWRASMAYGEAYRAPSFDDLYWPGAGNPSLRPERSRNFEAGLRFDDGDRQISVFAYRNRVHDLIQWAPTGLGGAWQPSNVARADLRGVTLSGRQALGNLALRASVDLQRPEDAGTGRQLMLRARQHASLGIDHTFGPWQWSADWQLQGKRYNDAANTVRLAGYGLLHLTVRRELARDWQLLARLENALDQDYERSAGYNTPGRNLFVSLRYQPR